jgi:hypothetical protein
MFAIGRSTVRKVVREVIRAINLVYLHMVQWPHGERLNTVMLDFKNWSSMPSVHGTIDCTHVEIAKPHYFLEDYYYYKTVVTQAVVD